MLTKTIGQLSAASSINDADYIEIEQSGVSKYGTIQMVGDALVSTSAESVLGSSNSVLITPATLRAGINAENSPPIYAVRAWVNFLGSTVSSSITAAFTRAAGSASVTCVATAHGCITGNVQYASAASGTISTNSYIVTYVDADTFTISTTSTSSSIGTITLFRCPINNDGNISNVSRVSTGVYYVNFSVAMPSAYYAVSGIVGHPNSSMLTQDPAVTPTSSAIKIFTENNAGTLLDGTVYLQVVA